VFITCFTSEGMESYFEQNKTMFEGGKRSGNYVELTKVKIDSKGAEISYARNRWYEKPEKTMMHDV